MKQMNTLGLLLLVILMTGCNLSFDSNAEKNYVRSKNGANLVIPPPLTSALVSHFYDLPPQTANPHVSIRPPQRA